MRKGTVNGLTYSQRKKLAQDQRASQLWRKWSARYEDPEAAHADLIQAINRWAKSRLCRCSRSHYPIKDRWIQRHQSHLVSAQKVRDERHWDEVWTLYVHRFEVGGREYSFHSYIKPVRLDEGLAESIASRDDGKPAYGRTLTPEEIAAIGMSWEDALLAADWADRVVGRD